MSQLLETVMLVCFGLSWPINLIKGIRSKTAAGTSLKFLLLILFGYIAGVAAKIVSHQFNYVLTVYFVNIIFVVCNLVVFFINSNRDRKALD